MVNDLTPNQRKLAERMSEVSERCYNAGWMEGLEYVLWDAVIRGERSYGYDSITQEDICALRRLSEVANCWIIFDNQLEEKGIDLDAWNKQFIRDTGSNLELLKG